MHGIVVGVYTSGAREVLVGAKVDTYGEPILLDQPYPVIIKESDMMADPLE